MPKVRKPPQEVRDSAEFVDAVTQLGQRLRRFRQRLGLTLDAAEEATGIDWKHIQKIEAAKLNVTIATIVRLATGYGVTLESLFRTPRTRANVPPRKAPPRPAPARSRKG